MPVLILLGLVGFGAQLINTGLGMGYGITSTTTLLAVGATPALASATVNVSQVGSQLMSGVAHWRFGNVDWPVVRRVAVPGAVGGFAGALFLSRLAVSVAAPLMAAILLVLGTYLLVRFTVRGTPTRRLGVPLRGRFLIPLGLVGGFVNSAGGAGWGPVGMSALLASGRLEPRTVVGSVSASEFAVVTAGSAGFLLGLGLGGFNPLWALVMLAGGVVAAPIAAWLARWMPARLTGSLVGGLIVATNGHSLLRAVSAPAGVVIVGLGLVLVLWVAGVGWSTRAHLRERRSAPVTPAETADVVPAASGAARGSG